MAETELTADQKKSADLAQRWITELDGSEKWQAPWCARGKRIIRRYKNERYLDNDASAASLGAEGRRFAILWSNVQTLGPAIYARTPQPAVSRRYRDADPVGKYASEVLERALSFSIDQYDFDSRMYECRDDYLLPGRGQLWVRYVPHTAPMNQATPDETAQDVQITSDSESEGAQDSITYQEVLCDHVAYDDFGMQPCRSWSETDYVWRRVYMTRAQLVERFGKIGRKVPLDWAPKDDPKPSDQPSKIKKAAIYEVWDKPTGKVYWINKAWPVQPLDVRDDPLGLSDFFPCPKPLMATTPPDNFIPVPDYIYYQDQAEELDELTQRIGLLTDALRMVGVYAGEENTKLQNVFQGIQNQLIPIDNWAALQDKGGLKGVIEWLPIDMVANTLKACFETRQRILDDIYQITGLSDIIRGESDPRETATAQQIKGQWGSLRVRDRQKEIARFARDVMDIKAQVIAKWFTVDTLKAMTDVKLLTMQEKQVIQTQMSLAQQAAQMAQQTGQQPPPPPQIDPAQIELLKQPTWEDVDALLKNNALRSFRIDIETDSTVEPDEIKARAAFVEFGTMASELLMTASQILPAAPYAAPLFAELMKQGARTFNVNPQMEDAIESVFEKAGQQPPAPPEGQTGPNPEIEAAKLQTEQQRTQTDAQLAQQEMQLRQQEFAVESQLQKREQDIKIVALNRDPKPQSVS